MKTLAERFCKKVRQSENSDSCWAWTGAKCRAGYGRLQRGRRGEGVVKAHRASWEIHFGAIPAGRHVCHRCDNPECTNPAHLFLGDHADNMADAQLKGRMARPELQGQSRNAGETNGQAKLSALDVRRIQALLASGATQAEAGRAFGVRQQHVSKIARGLRRARDLKKA